MQFDQHRCHHAGFTLIELMITVAIIGILAAIALPNYTNYLTRARIVEAASTLSAQRVRMEQFYQDARTYNGACAAGTVAPTPAATADFVFACIIPVGGQTYSVTATGQGRMSGFVFSVDQSNNRTTTVTGNALAAGYTSSTTCWIRAKPNQC